MKKFIQFFGFLFIIIFLKWGEVRGQGNENFSNIGTNTSYGTRTWAGSGGTWTATDAREDQTINGKSITIRNGSLTSPNVSNGVGNLTITTQLKFAGTSSNFDVFVNGTNVGTLPYNTTVTTTTISNINISGSIQIVLTNQSSSNRVAIDDVIWTSYSAPSSTSTLSAGAGTEPSSFSSLINTQTSSTLNFDFSFTDDGATPATDIADTQISQIVFKQGTGNNITDWTQAIQGAELSDGTNSTTTATINATNITFASLLNGAGQLGRINDNAIKTYTLKIWLKTALGGTLPTTIDGQRFVFEVNNSGTSSFTFVAGGLAASQSVNSGNTNNAVSVVATQLSFSQQPPSNTLINTAMSPSVSVQTTDANGNRDLNFTNNISITSTGTLDSSPQTASASSGLASFGIFHTALGTGLTLNATSSGLTSATSNVFNIATTLALEPGDIAILGFNYDRDGAGQDEIIIVFFKDVQNGTTLDITDNAFKKCGLVTNPSLATNPIISSSTPDTGWGVSEGWIRLTYSGASPFPAGRTLTFRVTPGSPPIVSIIAPTASGWSGAKPANVGDGFNLNGLGEQIFFLAGGNPNDNGSSSACSAAGTYTGGKFLYGFNTKGNYWIPSCQNSGGTSNSGGCGANDPSAPTNETIYGGTKNSAKPANFDCYLAYPTVQADYNAYTGDLTPATKSTWIGRIRNPNNWTGYANTTDYNTYANPTFTNNTATNSGRLLTIDAGGFTAGVWTGVTSTDWFECSNWQNLRIPDQNTSVNISSVPTNNPKIDIGSPFANFYSNIADCRNLNISSSNLQIEANTNNRLDVRGNITISSTGQIDMNDGNNTTNDGTINLYGNFTNQLTNGLDEGNGLINFVGTNEQTIQNSNGNESFYRININKVSNDVKLLSNINLTSYSATNNGQITLIQNDINLNGNNIDLGSLGTLNENLASNHLIKDNTATFDKGTIVGVSGGYVRTSAKTITTSNNTMAGIGLHLSRTTGSDYDVEVDRFHYSGWSSTRTVKRVFHVKTTSGTESGSNSNLKMFFANDELNGLSNGTDGTLTAWRLPNSSQNAWAYHPTISVTHNTLSRTVEATSVNAFSHWAMTPPNIPLGSCIIDFQAQKTELTTAKLTWKVILQDLPQKFEVQKSFDGINFINIATIDANVSPNYTLDDYQLLQSSYYRLKILKTSGEIELSPIRYLRIENGFIIYPNPVSNFIKIEGKNIGICTMKLFEISGKNLLDNRGTLLQMNEVLNQYLPNLPKGMYFLQINTDQQRFVHKLIKE
ncbi:MAG: T9SS C-terminal target domain-containing protein [Cytophagales bacterium]|nr:MAG: T9SS C-terminal target domain-containing protein [Cytophagales bacterium]